MTEFTITNHMVEAGKAEADKLGLRATDIQLSALYAAMTRARVGNDQQVVRRAGY